MSGQQSRTILASDVEHLDISIQQISLLLRHISKRSSGLLLQTRLIELSQLALSIV